MARSRRKRLNRPSNGPSISSSRVVNSKIPDTLTRSLPFVVQNLDLDHTIKPCHWTRPFTPHFRPSDRGKFLVETVIFVRYTGCIVAPQYLDATNGQIDLRSRGIDLRSR